MRQYLLDNGVAKAAAYDETMYIMAGLLLIGLICNLLMRPVHERHVLVEDHLPSAMIGDRP